MTTPPEQERLEQERARRIWAALQRRVLRIKADPDVQRMVQDYLAQNNVIERLIRSPR